MLLQEPLFLRKEFSLDGYEYVMFDFKCSIILFSNPYSTMSGVLYVTENFLCFMGTKCKKLKIPINEITALNYESSHQHFDIIISTTSEKYQISFKNSPKDLDQIIIIFYLWYHTPTYFANDDINKAIAIYEKERIKKEELKEKEKRTDIKKQQRNRLLKEIGLNDSTKGSRGNLNISKRARDLNESSPSYIVISTQPLNPKTKYAKQFIIESEALYLIKDTYLPVFIVLDENHFSLTINPNFPYQESLWSLKKILKKDSVINTLFSYDNVSIITVESEYEHILIEFRGSEVTIRLCTAYIQLLLNQFYLKNKQFDIKWGTAITPFAYEHPVITKLFFLLKKPEFLTSDTSSSAKDT